MMESRYEEWVVNYEYFVIEEGETIQLLTFTRFQPENCNSLKLVEVNSFDKSTKEWRHNNFWIDKFSNFNGCPIDILIEPNDPEFIVDAATNKTNSFTGKCTGYLCAIIKDFASSLNYSYRIILRPDSGSVTFHVFLLTTRVNMPRKLGSYTDKLTITRPVYFNDMMIAIPPSK